MIKQLDRAQASGANPVSAGQPEPSRPPIARHAETPGLPSEAPGGDPLGLDDPFAEADGHSATGVRVARGLRGPRKVGVLLLVFGLLMTAIAVVMISYLRDGERLNQLAQESGRALIETQHIARLLDGEPRVDEAMTADVASRRAAIDDAVAAIAAINGPVFFEDPLRPAVEVLTGDWTKARNALAALTSGADNPVRERRAVADSLSFTLEDLGARGAEIVRIAGAARTRNPLSEAASITLQIAEFGRAVAPASRPEAFGSDQARRALAALDALDRHLARISGEAGFPESLVTGFGNELRLARAATAALAPDAPLTQRASAVVREARESVDHTADGLRGIRDGLIGGDAQRTVLLQIAGGLAFLAALCALALSRAYVWLGNTRAEQAEQQRAQAERLQIEAKRTNDQNQAAILRLMNELQEVADGDLTVQATVSEDITGAIADSVNYTIEELRSLVSRINSTAEMVNDASSKAQHTSARLLAASAQQSREIRETGEAVLGLAQQIEDVSSQAARSVQVAKQSQNASREGSRAVDHAIAGMNMIRDQIQETAKRIKRLGESSQEIGEIVEMISGLSEQTNVLALNAAIQAASAGEAGRGFSFVAEEVQRLAERSADATKQIAVLIQTIQADTQDAVAAMERCTQGVVDGTRRSDEAGAALGQIQQVSAQMAELIDGFSSTTSEHASSAATVAESIQRMLQVTEQTSQGTAETAGSIQQLSELALELKNSVSRFKVT